MKKAILIIALLAPLAAFSQTTSGHGVTTPGSETTGTIKPPVKGSVVSHIIDQAIDHPKDTTIQLTISLDQFKSLLYVIDQNIDSKRESKQVIDFLTHSARIVEDKKK